MAQACELDREATSRNIGAWSEQDFRCARPGFATGYIGEGIDVVDAANAFSRARSPPLAAVPLEIH